MTDLEMTKLCAEAMGIEIDEQCTYRQGTRIYHPLHDDAQAMALVKKFPMTIEPPVLTVDGYWHIESVEIIDGICPDVYDKDLNRAICECVAKIEKAKHAQG